MRSDRFTSMLAIRWRASRIIECGQQVALALVDPVARGEEFASSVFLFLCDFSGLKR